MSVGFAEFVEQLPLIDHHVHVPSGTDGSQLRFQKALNEAHTGELSEPSWSYDSQLGFALRRWCPPLLDLAVHATPGQYWARRSELGEVEVARRLTRAAGVSDWLVDTGYSPDGAISLQEMAALSGGATHEILRLETMAESLIGSLDDPRDFADTFCEFIAARRAQVVGAKSVLAYRAGLDHDLSRPGASEVAEAARRWRHNIDRTGVTRLADPTLLAFGINAAIDSRLPLQIHVGFGDRELDLRTANPLHLRDFLRDNEPTGVPVLLLHCYPFEREAGYLAQAFETVHLDVGLATNFVGARSSALIARSLELAAFHKILYSSDGFGPAELHYLGARQWRTAITTVIGQWVAAGEWTDCDARRVVTLIARDNARRVYNLP